MAGKPRNPEPVGSIGDASCGLADAVFLRIRQLPHAPVSVYVRMGEVYVLSQAYKITAAWDAAYPESFAGSFTRMERPHQIARKLARVIEEPEPV